MCVFLYNKIGGFFVVAGNFHYDRKKRYITTGKKRYSRLSDGCAVLAITTGKKRYSRLSGGLCCCISFWFWREISIFFVMAVNFDYDRKKKDTVVCWREISSFFVVAGNFHYDRKKNTLWPEKKIFNRLSDGWVRSSGDYDRKKKDTVVCLAGCAVVLVKECLSRFFIWTLILY